MAGINDYFDHFKLYLALSSQVIIIECANLFSQLDIIRILGKVVSAVPL